MNKLGSDRFVNESNQIFHLHDMVLNTIDLLTDRLGLDMNRKDFRDENLESQPVIIHETNKSAYLRRRTLFVLEKIWLYLPMVVHDFGGRVESVLPSLNEQSKMKENVCFCAKN